jgi:hypothetical protein
MLTEGMGGWCVQNPGEKTSGHVLHDLLNDDRTIQPSRPAFCPTTTRVAPSA